MNDDGPSCRVCYGDESDGPLFSPCRCSGSLKYIHQSCWARAAKYGHCNPECNVCGYECKFVVKKIDSRVTTEIYLDALEMYALSGLFRLILLGSLYFPILLLWDEPSPWSRTACLSIQAIIVKGICSRIKLSVDLFGYQFLKNRLPTFTGKSAMGKNGMIRMVEYSQVLKEGVAFTTVFLTFAWAACLMVKELLKFFPPAETTATHSLFHVSTLYTVCVAYKSADYTYRLISMRSQRPAACFVHRTLHRMCVGRLVNSFLAAWFTGYLPFSSTSLAAQLVWDTAVGYFCCDKLIALFYIYSLKHFVPELLFFEWPFLYGDKWMCMTAVVLGPIWSLLFLVTHLFVPVIVTYYFFPNWLNAGECLRPSYGDLFSDSAMQEKVDFLSSTLAGLNSLAKMAFLIDYVSCMLPLYWSLDLLRTVIHRMLNTHNKQITAITATVEFLLASPMLSIVITLYYWTIVFIGRSTLYLTANLIPQHYQDDVFMHLTIGFCFCKVLVETAPRAVKHGDMIVGCLSIACSYYAFFCDIRYTPILPETVFMLVSMYYFDQFQNEEVIFDTSKRLLLGGLAGLPVAVAWYLLRDNYGIPHILGVCMGPIGFFIVATCITGIVANSLLNFIRNLKLQLEDEYCEIVKELMNYDASEVDQKTSPLKNAVDKVVNKWGDWSVFEALLLKVRNFLLGDRKEE
ncbi:hypothetical protein QR680_011201 [Steinernema hermaphroditum]|uniref:RING-CH-type domain-containing protein n=1 Tax=Steinernema hermaphroditum TaxID=289476 RepID=A0AA39IRF0_9BILA|nr:hypothetical protein QR680_011201 [Steinernema hermaphroditum]